MATITIKDGILSATIYIQVTHAYKCLCGAELTITMQLPEDVSYTGEINIEGVNCHNCGKPVVIPYGHHYIENYQLLTK